MTPAEAAARAARENGAFLYDEVAAEIARAVLEAHDTTFEVSEWVARENWNIPDYREHIRRHLRHALLLGLADKGLLPVEAPTESLRYLAHGYWSTKTSEQSSGVGPNRVWLDSYVGAEVPADRAEAGTIAWETVVITLKVPVREAAS
ncbi:hypothetical protein [Streptosporangium sp. NPDC048865]|uniref:hypothetical protein n=1 Tax=Streptosporangium sp. NPDC048865 TaxID=3155766 RepID=UPI0034339FB9